VLKRFTWPEIGRSDFCDHWRLEIALHEIRLAVDGEFGWSPNPDGGCLIGRHGRRLGARARHQFPVIVPQDLDILAGHDEVLLLHALALVPVDERTFAEHQVELLAQSRPRARYGRRVGHHANGPAAAAHQLVFRGHGWDGRPAVDADLEPGRTPLDEFQAFGVPDLPDGVIDVFGHHVAAVQHAARDVLAVVVLLVAELEQLVAGFETSGRQVYDWRPLVRGPLGGCERRVRQQREVDARERHQVGLELVDVHVERSREPQRRGDGRHHLADDAVQVVVHGPLNVQLAGADVVYRLVVHNERAVGRVKRFV